MLGQAWPGHAPDAKETSRSHRTPLRRGAAGLGYRPMITVGCAGFPVPATRYFREFSFVEVQETHVSLPGPGTIRRWKREAPNGFRFALLGPREVGQEGFRDGKVIETALKSIEAVADELEAKTAVFVAPPEFTPTKSNK